MHKNKRYFLIIVALVALFLSSVACGKDEAYGAIQDGQNAVKEAGDDVKEASENAGLNEEVDLEIDEKIEKVEKDVHQACLDVCYGAFGPDKALEDAGNLQTCYNQCGDK